MRIWIRYLLIGLLTFTIGAITSYSITTQGLKFFEISINNLINLTLGIFVAYYLVQRKTDERKEREIGEKILTNIQNLINRSEYSDPRKANDESMILSNNRRISNQITALNKMAESLCLKTELEYLLSEFKKYKLITDTDFSKTFRGDLSKEEYMELIIIVSNIDSKCTESIVKLYHKNNKKI